MRAAALAAGLLPLAAGAALAQRAELRLVAGFYQPMTDQARSTDASTGQGAVYRLGSAPAFGGRATLWLSDVFGLEVGGVRAQPPRTVAAAVTASSPSTITMLSAGAVRKLRLGDATSLRLGAGYARVRVSGISYDTATVTLETVTGGVTVSAAVTRTLGSRFLLVLGIEDWIYQLDAVRSAPSLVPSVTQTVRQNDLVLSLGLAARL